MLLKELSRESGKCTLSGCVRPSEVLIIGYAPVADPQGEIELCPFHATQLARILLEDLCAALGDRHG